MPLKKLPDLAINTKKRLADDRQSFLPAEFPIDNIKKLGYFAAADNNFISSVVRSLLTDTNDINSIANSFDTTEEGQLIDTTEALRALMYQCRKNLYTCTATQDIANTKTIYTTDDAIFPRNNRFDAVTGYRLIIPAANDYEDVRILIPQVGNVEKSIKKTDGSNFGIGELTANAIVDIIYIPSLDYFKCVEFKNIPPVPLATETTAGILEIATEAEAITGTADDKTITPNKLKAVLDNLGGAVYNYNDFPLTAFNTTTNLTFNAGKYLNANNFIINAPTPINKTISASFTAGTNNGGLFPSVSLTANSWLYCFRIKNTTSGDVDAGFDNNIGATNIPSGYESAKFVGMIRINASSQIFPFIADRVGAVCKTLLTTNANIVITGSGVSPRTISTGILTNKIRPVISVICGPNPGAGGYGLYDDRGNTFILAGNLLPFWGGNTAFGGALGVPSVGSINNLGQFLIKYWNLYDLSIYLSGFEFNL